MSQQASNKPGAYFFIGIGNGKETIQPPGKKTLSEWSSERLKRERGEFHSEIEAPEQESGPELRGKQEAGLFWDPSDSVPHHDCVSRYVRDRMSVIGRLSFSPLSELSSTSPCCFICFWSVFPPAVSSHVYTPLSLPLSLLGSLRMLPFSFSGLRYFTASGIFCVECLLPPPPGPHLPFSFLPC